MRNALRLPVLAMLTLATLPVAAHAEQGEDAAAGERRPQMTREERRAAWEALSEEEKQAKREEMRARREQMRAEWEAMTPEEREAKRAEIRKRMEAMTPEQREAMRKRVERRRRHGGQQAEKPASPAEE